MNEFEDDNFNESEDQQEESMPNFTKLNVLNGWLTKEQKQFQLPYSTESKVYISAMERNILPSPFFQFAQRDEHGHDEDGGNGFIVKNRGDKNYGLTEEDEVDIEKKAYKLNKVREADVLMIKNLGTTSYLVVLSIFNDHLLTIPADTYAQAVEAYKQNFGE